MTADTIDDDIQLLSRYVDGELPAADSRALEARLHREPELRADLVRIEELNHRLRDLMAEQDQVPAAIREMLEQSSPAELDRGSNVVAFPGASTGAISSPQPRWAYAMAASIAAAVAVTMVMNSETGNSLPGNDRIVSTALDTQPSGSPWTDLQDGRELRTVLTFPHEDGRWCREYLLRGGDSDWRAVACREEDRWVTQAAGLESFLDTSDAYGAAGSGDAEPVAVFINQHAADIALGASEERALMDKGWR